MHRDRLKRILASARTSLLSVQVRAQTRGQAMVEYSMLNWVLVIALVMGMSVRMIPAPDGGAAGGRPMNVIELFLWAYQIYYDSFYFVLNLPFP